jgi:hypothetical protein
MGRTACTVASVELYLYSTYGLYGLYSSLSRAIPLLPIWAVQPVQSLSRAIPLLPLWAVRPVQSLRACTRVTFTFTWESKTKSLVVEPVAQSRYRLSCPVAQLNTRSGAAENKQIEKFVLGKRKVPIGLFTVVVDLS